ncbi:MAG: cation:proton antiporter [candidate division KSB1 bacterium]|nr:cation:proton antiporter [candidate division KSB1 bacterium]
MDIPLLRDIVILFSLSIIVLFLCHRFKIPAIVGFLLTGIVVGPYGLGLIEAIHEVEVFAEIGVVLLLFTIGIEFSFERLLQIKKAVLLGGSLQVLLTSFVGFWLVRQFGFARDTGEAVFIGFLIALSSTAIVLKMLQERAEIDSPHGRTTLGILIFQDIVIVPMILITPFLAGMTGGQGASVILLLFKGIGIIGLVVLAAKWAVPYLLYHIARTRNHELFLLSVVVICFGVAWFTSSAGLSLALGAFLAGLIISESEYSHHALGNILPFRDVFTTFFFVSIGMMLNLGFLLHEFALILIMVTMVFILKTVVGAIVTVLLGFPLRIGILVGFSISQIGEFSFILSRVGLENGLLSGDINQRFLAVTILSMAATPFIIILAPRLANAVATWPLPKWLLRGMNPPSEPEMPTLHDHLVIIGFGVNGRNVARAAKEAGIAYTIIEMNPETVRSEIARGESIFYGDATRETTLKHARVEAARVVVVAINDPTATRRITEAVRRLNPDVHLIVRTRYVQEMQPLYGLGANEVIPEEFETSVEIFARVLNKFFIPRDKIEQLIARVRADGYEMFRSLTPASNAASNLKIHFPDIDISAFRIPADSPFVHQSLAGINLRRRYGISVVAIERDSEVITNPDADMVLQPDDILYVLGPAEKVAKAVARFIFKK